MSVETVITKGIGTYDQYPINIAAEYHHNTKPCSLVNPPYERNIWEHQSSMKLERKLGINQKEERKLIGWNLELKKETAVDSSLIFLFTTPESAARSTKVSLRKVGTHGTIGWLIAKIIGRYWDLKRGKWLGLILGLKTLLCVMLAHARSLQISDGIAQRRALFPTKGEKVGRQPDDSPIWWFVRGAFVLEAGSWTIFFRISNLV